MDPAAQLPDGSVERRPARYGVRLPPRGMLSSPANSLSTRTVVEPPLSPIPTCVCACRASTTAGATSGAKCSLNGTSWVTGRNGDRAGVHRRRQVGR